jgi:hypothetical protein
VTRLHDPQHGIPHDEFVRRKRRERRLDRSLGLVGLVRWPGWTGPALLLVPFPIVAVLGALDLGSIDGALVAPALFAALLVLGIAYAIAREGIDRLLRRRRGKPTVDADDEIDADGSFRGPKPQLILVLAVLVLPTLFLGTLLTGGSLQEAAASTILPPLPISSCFGAAIVITRIRQRIRRRRRGV